jgi:hypothetical protein
MFFESILIQKPAFKRKFHLEFNFSLCIGLRTYPENCRKGPDFFPKQDSMVEEGPWNTNRFADRRLDRLDTLLLNL